MMTPEMLKQFIEELKNLEKTAETVVDEQVKAIGPDIKEYVFNDNFEMQYDEEGEPLKKPTVQLDKKRAEKLKNAIKSTQATKSYQTIKEIVSAANIVHENIELYSEQLDDALKLLKKDVDSKILEEKKQEAFLCTKLLEQSIKQLRILSELAKGKVTPVIGSIGAANEQDNKKMAEALFSGSEETGAAPSSNFILAKLKACMEKLKGVAKKIIDAFQKDPSKVLIPNSLNDLLNIPKNELENTYRVKHETYLEDEVQHGIHKHFERDIRKSQVDFLHNGLQLIKQQAATHKEPSWALQATKGLLLSLQYQLDKEWPRLAKSRFESMIIAFLQTPDMQNVSVKAAVTAFDSFYLNAKNSKPLTDNPDIIKKVSAFTGDVDWQDKRQAKESLPEKLAEIQQPRQPRQPSS